MRLAVGGADEEASGILVSEGGRDNSTLGRDSSITREGDAHKPQQTEHKESKDHPHHLLGLGRVLGLEKDKEDEHNSKEQGEGWKEFKKGERERPGCKLLACCIDMHLSLPSSNAHRPL